MSEEEFITKFYSCDNEEQCLKDIYHNLNCLQEETQQLKADYGTKAQVERDLLLEENQQLKEKIALRNKEKTDICNRIHNQKEKIKRHKAEITNLIAKNQQLKIQISAREEEYKKLEEALNTKHYCKYANKCNEWVDCSREEYADMVQSNIRLVNNWNELKEWLKKELGDRINPNKDKWLTGVYDAYRETIDKMQELERGVSNE